MVEVCPGGPLLVRGTAYIRDAAGNEVPRRRGTVAVCRCGGSSIPPWCDGTHKLLARRSAASASSSRG
jgi:CDGSH-type Zn-finger protein